MKSLLFIVAICVSLCVAQNVNETSEDCKGVCQKNGRCPSATGIIWRVQWLPYPCRMCIKDNCGSPGKSNRTETAECMFAARLMCNGCSVTNAVRRYHENCMVCMATCGQQTGNENDNGTKTSGTTVETPKSRSSFKGRFGSSRSRFHSRRGQIITGFRPFNLSQRFTTRNRTVCSCVTTTSCPRRHQIQKSMRRYNSRCRRCVSRSCPQRWRSSRRNYFRCVIGAQSDCARCPNVTRTMHEQMRNCGRCERRCRTIQVQVFTFGQQRPGNLCEQNCVAPSYCPSTSSIISTVNWLPSACRMCIREACGVPTNENRDETAQCMFEARSSCTQCRIDSGAQRRRERCAMCRRECSDDSATSGNVMMTTTSTTTTVATLGSTMPPTEDEIVDTSESSGEEEP